MIQVYQNAISPWWGRQCRFYPSCSDYAKEALMKRGLGPGLWLTAKRVSKCHPFHSGGVDFLEKRTHA